MAISQEDIKARIAQIQQAGGGDTAATRAQIAKEAQQYGVTPEQIGTATGLLGTQVRQMAEEAGQAFEPLKLAGGGMLGGTSVTTPTTPVTPQTGLMQGTTVDVTPKTYTPQVTGQNISKAYAGDQSALSDILLNTYTSGGDTKALRPLLEQISKTATGDKGTDPAYNFLVGSTAEAALRNEYNSAVASGDFKKAQEIDRAIKEGGEAPLRYYEKQYGEGTAHTLTQDLFNDPFGIGEPGKYVTTVLDRIGDATMDVVSNPYVQAAVAVFGGPVGKAVSPIMQAAGTLDSGRSLSPTQIVAALGGVSELSGLEGGNWIDIVPEEFQDTALAMKKALDEGWDEAASAFKNATDLTSEEFAKVEDAFRVVLGDENIQAFSEGVAGVEDDIRTVVGDDNIEAFSSGLAGVEDNLKDLFEGQFGGVDNRLGSIEETLALLEQASLNRGGGFTPQRGAQGPVARPRLTKYEDSDVLAVMNLPSSVQQRP